MKCTRKAHEVKIWITSVNRLEHPDRRNGRHSRSSPASDLTQAGADIPLMPQRQRHETKTVTANLINQGQRVIDQ